jgi:hypothetical protein
MLADFLLPLKMVSLINGFFSIFIAGAKGTTRLLGLLWLQVPRIFVV